MKRGRLLIFFSLFYIIFLRENDEKEESRREKDCIPGQHAKP